MITEEKRRCDPETERALRLFVALSRCAFSVGEHARRDISRRGMSVSAFGVLELLYHKGPQTLSSLSAKVLLTQGSMTYVVDQLQAQGFVRRVPCLNDRRVTYVELTEEGRAHIAALFPSHAAVIRRAVEGLSAQEQEALTNLLKRLGHAAAETPLNHTMEEEEVG